jgi:predicted Zn-dependent protease
VTARAATLADVLSGARLLDENPARRQALESGDRPALEAALRAHPDDQAVAAALAAQRHREGETADALRRLEALGSPGRMTPSVRGLYAQLLAEAGRVAEADELLTRTIEQRLPRYQSAQRALLAAVEQEQRAPVERARAGVLPDEIRERLRNQPEAEQQRIFTEWLTAQLRASPTLAALRATRDAHADVVSLALSAGMIKLRRANSLDGAARTTVLAEAERLFLAIRDEADGSTDFRLGLGQVYHRLGRAAQGDREMAAVLREGGPQEKLSVANVYRELGNRDRARDRRGRVQPLHRARSRRPGDAALAPGRPRRSPQR